MPVARAYNNWLSHELCQPSDGKLFGMALLPVQDAQEAATELRRATTELKLCGGMLPTDGPHLLGDPKYDVIYRTAAELDCPLALHGSGSLLGQSLDTFPKFIPDPYDVTSHFDPAPVYQSDVSGDV